jgi:hypothetical protein
MLNDEMTVNNLDDYFQDINLKLNIDTVKKYRESANHLVFNYNQIAGGYSSVKKIASFDNVLDDFINEYSASLTMIKVPKQSYLSWHRDSTPVRSSCINVILDDYQNHMTYFSDLATGTDFIHTTNKIWQCTYSFLTPKIVNVHQRIHCVFNSSEQDRYVLCINTNKLTYTDTVKWFDKL